MKFWKWLLAGFAWVVASETIIFSANLFHEEPWRPTSEWLASLGTFFYYTVGIVDRAAEDFVATAMTWIPFNFRSVFFVVGISVFWGGVIFLLLKSFQFLVEITKRLKPAR